MEELRASIPEKLRPCDFPLPAPRPPRERFLNKEEARALLDNATSFHTKIFILLGMTTGQRAGAILGLTWDRVLWSSGVIDFRDPDRGENRKKRGVCPVDPRILSILQEAFALRTCNHVIEFKGRPVQSIKKAFATAAIHAGLHETSSDGKRTPTASPHILKHSVISWLAMDGWTVDAISDFTSTDAKTVKRIYRKVNPGYLRELATTLSDGLFDGFPTLKTSNEPHKSAQRVPKHPLSKRG